MTALQQYVDIWWRSVGDFVELVSALPQEDWSRPTDLPGWDVRAVVSHVAHLEGVLGGAPEESVAVPELAHVVGPMGRFTEIGVITRRDVEPASVVEQIRRYTAARHADLLATPPTDPGAPAPGIFGLIGWNDRTLLRNRPLDIWMHEQDIRRATGHPGNLDSPGARHSADYLLESMGFVLGKRLKAAPGTTLVAAVEGHRPTAITVDGSGRGVSLPEPPTEPDVTLRMGRETFILLAGGRRPAARADVVVDGDTDLAARFLAALAVTP
ncbi:maleylpyruvate isomerase family mycothiol-dependent enzyme [Nocardioides sp. BP30]|uniref:maleylpyruvate isomerase family mycothiol-dependent enzyme n=1 Tax=Nocardioides sp. BP30 TaxID=3036374 RepID=UPI0024685B0F|nr:maleylpyruvate isomerase family mycothiol-dependent enzyme [Nocardioides sp. BP30]WGL52785.1 maleylpyruvate isomerase family mycothiol-dependent enzyme [Nocardioides sp. BP30]